jgi:hypothetical protein
MRTHAEIVEILNQDVYSAQARLKAARTVVDAIITDWSGTLPQPDGNDGASLREGRRCAGRERGYSAGCRIHLAPCRCR